MMSLDPRTRLCLFLLAIVATLATGRLFPLCALCAGGALVVVALGAWRQWARALRLLLPMLLLLTLFSGIGGAVGEAFLPALKLLALGTWSVALFAAVSVDELADTFSLWHLPAGVSFVLVGGLRYAPMMAEWWTDLIEARRARGAEIPRGVRALPVYASLVVPTIVRALRTADEMAEAMEARGFGARNATPATSYRLTLRDWVLIALGGVGFCLYLRTTR